MRAKEVTVMRRYAQDEVNYQNEVDGMRMRLPMVATGSVNFAAYSALLSRC